MPGNSPFRNSARDGASPPFSNLKSLPPCRFQPTLRNCFCVPLLLLLSCLWLPAQVHKVDPDKTITFQVDGATAAYSLDAFFAEASAENGLVSIQGKVAGVTHVVVVTPSGVQSFEILVSMLPPVYPPGFVAPFNPAEPAQSGFYEGRFYSSPAEIQNQFDFRKNNGDDWTHMNVVGTNLLGADQGLPRFALSSATYEVFTPDRDIALFDKYVTESPLTINGSIIRGLHARLGNWFVHAGYTSVATFDGLFLPIQPELVVGGGYHRPLTPNSSFTASFYQIQVRAADQGGRSGSIGDLRYQYKPRENFWFNADLGISHGIAGSGRLHYITARDNIEATVRYLPLEFASLGANNLRGLHADFSWTRHVTKRFESSLVFYDSQLVLPGIRETTISGSANLRYQLTRHWALTGGALGSSFRNELPPGPAIRNFTLPAGLAFQSRHFGASGQYQFSVTPGEDSGAKQFRASLHSGWGAFNFSAYAERDANAPTLSFIFGQVTGLERVLDQQGIQAATVQQVDQLLSSDAYLIAAGYVKGASINVVPLRTLAGGSVDWSTRGAHKTDLRYSFQYNDNQALQGSTQDVVHTLAFTQRLDRSDDLSASCSVLGLKNPGSLEQYSPVCLIAFRRQFHHVPDFIIPERRGTITGNVFRDDQSQGQWEPGMPPMPDVEVTLDDVRRTRTGPDGSYSFPGVHRGKHKIEAIYTSAQPYFFTTPSNLKVDEDATTNFGIGYLLAGLAGQILNDAGQGVAGITVAIESSPKNQTNEKKWTASTQADGSFFVPSLAAGDYLVQPDGDSLPAGYSVEGFGAAQTVTVGAASPGKAAFTVRAFRSIAGLVLAYDPKESRYVPVNGAQVILQEPGLTSRTDALGRYLFRDLAAGSYTISVQNQAQAPARTVRLSAQPADLTNLDFQISRPATPEVPAPAAVPVPAPVPAPAAVQAPVAQPAPTATVSIAAIAPIAATAQQHNLAGRQLTKAGKYQEAFVELTEAIRISPDFAVALNARGYVLVLLRQWAPAIEDLDRAIRLDPGYANAYQIRAAAKRSIGDAAGAAADAKRALQLAHCGLFAALLSRLLCFMAASPSSRRRSTPESDR